MTSGVASNDQSVATERRITVEGETFVVRRRGKGDYAYDWISGPNPGYGFSGSTYPGGDLDDDAHEE